VRLGSTALVLALLLRLFPPGHSDQAHPPVKLAMPAALANGSRASIDVPRVTLHAVVYPAPAKLGEQLTYRAWAFVSRGNRVQFARPDAGGDFTWGDPHAGHHPSAGNYQAVDSAWVEMPLQVFRLGMVAVPGPAVQLTDEEGHVRITRLPTVHVLVAPMITAADSNATLRPLHGPLVAPWWERMPWGIVIAAGLIVAALLMLWRWLASRRRKPVPVRPSAVAAVRPAFDASAEALAALAKLRALGLPEQNRFGQHALELTRIQRRFLERTLGTPRPGDTSPELLNRLRASKLEPEDVTRLEGLLGLWDRVKFARAPLDAGEAHRCEEAVERLVRRRESPREVA
jgi:hypothetical protein